MYLRRVGSGLLVVALIAGCTASGGEVERTGSSAAGATGSGGDGAGGTAFPSGGAGPGPSGAGPSSGAGAGPGCSLPAVDPNGVAYIDLPGYAYDASKERFDATPDFGSDGSMRHDFEGTPDENQCLVGYFVVDGPEDEEISIKLGGGPHNDVHPEWADTYDLAVTDFVGTSARLRFEETHPIYSDSYMTNETVALGDLRGVWVGAMGCKLNVDEDADGEIDHVRVLGWVDPAGIDDQGQPHNAWVKTLDLVFSLDEVELKSPTVPYVVTIGHPEAAQATIRIDYQDASTYEYALIAYRVPVASDCDGR